MTRGETAAHELRDLDVAAETEKSLGRAPKPPPAEQEGRLRRARESLERHGLDALLVYGSAGANPEPLRFLSGYVNVFPTASAIAIVPREDHAILLVDQPWHLDEALKMSWIEDVRPMPAAGRSWLAGELVRSLAGGFAAAGVERGRVGVFRTAMPVVYGDVLAEAAPEAEVVDGSPVWEDVVGAPSAYDAKMIRRTARIADEGFAAAVEAAGEGVPEYEVCFAALVRMASLGAEFLHGSGVSTHINIGSFSEVVSNVRPFLYSTRLLEAGQMFWVDLSASYAGYFIDADRTVSVDEPTAAQQELYAVTRAMYEAMVGAARAGLPGGELWRVGTDVAVAAGYGDYSNHVYLGHTTGITTSARPVVARGETGTLRAGSFLNVEPGIFVPGLGSACIENALLIGDAEAEPVNRFPVEIQVV